MKRTPWYPCTVKPVRVGFYETRNRPAGTPDFFLDIHMDWWDGKYFCNVHEQLPDWTEAPNLHWRGLTEEQK